MRKNGSAPKKPGRQDGLVTLLGRHKRALAAVGGALAVTGLAIATGQPDDDATRSETVANSAPSTVVSSAPATAPAKHAKSAQALRPAAATAPSQKSDEIRIKDMKGAVAKGYAAGELVHPQRTPAYTGPTVPPDQITEVKVGDIRKNRRDMRIVSARGDLTGQRALAWVVDDGEKVGNAHCTQKIQLSNNPKPRVRPTLLLCWRTSATRSAYTLTIDLDRKPSKQAGVAALEKAWAKLS